MSENHTDPQQVPARAPYDHERAEAAVRELDDREDADHQRARDQQRAADVGAGCGADPW